jgi:hypothetical protein
VPEVKITRSLRIGHKIRGLTDQGKIYEVLVLDDVTFSEMVDDSEAQHHYIEQAVDRALPL